MPPAPSWALTFSQAHSRFCRWYTLSTVDTLSSPISVGAGAALRPPWERALSLREPEGLEPSGLVRCPAHTPPAADFLQKTKENVEKVTKVDVLRMAKAHLRPDKLQILVVGRPGRPRQAPFHSRRSEDHRHHDPGTKAMNPWGRHPQTPEICRSPPARGQVWANIIIGLTVWRTPGQGALLTLA